MKDIVLPRSPNILLTLAEDMCVTNNFALLPHRRLIPWVAGVSKPPQIIVAGVAYEATAPLTLCNCYASLFTAALGCPIPPMKANDQLAWLISNEGKMEGWFECNLTLALERAALGYPTVAVVNAQPKGHIGVMLPSPATDPRTPYVSAAGASNFVNDKLSRSFGLSSAACRYFTHN